MSDSELGIVLLFRWARAIGGTAAALACLYLTFFVAYHTSSSQWWAAPTFFVCMMATAACLGVAIHAAVHLIEPPR